VHGRGAVRPHPVCGRRGDVLQRRRRRQRQWQWIGHIIGCCWRRRRRRSQQGCVRRGSGGARGRRWRWRWRPVGDVRLGGAARAVPAEGAAAAARQLGPAQDRAPRARGTNLFTLFGLLLCFTFSLIQRAGSYFIGQVLLRAVVSPSGESDDGNDDEDDTNVVSVEVKLLSGRCICCCSSFRDPTQQCGI
jgi:hypothetical protein